MFEILTYATEAIAIASVIAAVTPTPKNSERAKALYQIIDVLAFNIGRAKDR